MDRTPTPRHPLSTLAAGALLAACTQLLADRAVDGQLLPGAKTTDAKTVLVVSLTPSTVDVDSGPSFSIGGFGFGFGSGRSSAVGVGVSALLGGGRVTTGFQADGRVTVSTGRLVGTVSAATAPPADLDAQFAALAKTVVDSADRAGLF